MSQLPAGLREFDDADAARKMIYDNALESVQKRFPVEDDQHILELKDAHYDGPMHFSLEQQKQALMNIINRLIKVTLQGAK